LVDDKNDNEEKRPTFNPVSRHISSLEENPLCALTSLGRDG